MENHKIVGIFGAYDEDKNDNLTYSITGNDSYLFDINSQTGELRFKNAPDFEEPFLNPILNSEIIDNNLEQSSELYSSIESELSQSNAFTDHYIDNTFFIKINAKDSLGLIDTKNLTIHVSDQIEHYPVLVDSTSSVSIEENIDIVATYSVTDDDMRDTISWLLTGDDADLFEINADGNQGQLKFKVAPDYETPLGGLSDDSNSYSLTVVASDMLVLKTTE